MQQLTLRQQKIIDFISKNNGVSNSEIAVFLGGKISRFTIVRDLEFLLKNGIIIKRGRGRGVHYLMSSTSTINAFFDKETYFKKDPDERSVKGFNTDMIKNLSQLFSKKEIEDLKKDNNKYLRRSKEMSKTLFKKEVERLTIELSWKSSQIEGNTYSLIDTEILIKERIESKGHKREEAIMILNHKNAIDYIFENKHEFKKIDQFQIEKVHHLLTRGLGIEKGIRTGRVRITGTKYFPIASKDKIMEVLNLVIDKINSLQDPFSKALALILMISYIQPFEDGNKRTSRILGNAILLAHNICPLSYRSVEGADYKKSILLFYEQNSARAFKELFIDQFKFATRNYF